MSFSLIVRCDRTMLGGGGGEFRAKLQKRMQIAVWKQVLNFAYTVSSLSEMEKFMECCPTEH